MIHGSRRVLAGAVLAGAVVAAGVTVSARALRAGDGVATVTAQQATEIRVWRSPG